MPSPAATINKPRALFGGLSRRAGSPPFGDRFGTEHPPPRRCNNCPSNAAVMRDRVSGARVSTCLSGWTRDWRE